MRKGWDFKREVRMDNFVSWLILSTQLAGGWFSFSRFKDYSFSICWRQNLQETLLVSCRFSLNPLNSWRMTMFEDVWYFFFADYILIFVEQSLRSVANWERNWDCSWLLPSWTISISQFATGASGDHSPSPRTKPWHRPWRAATSRRWRSCWRRWI